MSHDLDLMVAGTVMHCALLHLRLSAVALHRAGLEAQIAAHELSEGGSRGRRYLQNAKVRPDEHDIELIFLDCCGMPGYVAEV